MLGRPRTSGRNKKQPCSWFEAGKERGGWGCLILPYVGYDTTHAGRQAARERERWALARATAAPVVAVDMYRCARIESRKGGCVFFIKKILSVKGESMGKDCEVDLWNCRLLNPSGS